MHGKPVLEKEIARMISLRKRGHSLPEIAREVERGRGTVHRHLLHIKVLPRYRGVLRAKQGASKARAQEAWRVAAREARSYVARVDSRTRALIAAALYWGEGAKHDFSFTNGDPRMVRTFISCLKEFGILRKRITISVRVYEDLDRAQAVRFWIKLLGISPNQVTAIHTIRGKKSGKLPYGICRVRVVRAGLYLKLIKSIIALFPNVTSMPP